MPDDTQKTLPPIAAVRFCTTILRTPATDCVFLFLPNELLGCSRRVWITGTLNGKPIQATAHPWQGDQHIVTLSKKVCEKMGVESGDEVTLEFTFSARPPDPLFSLDVEQALVDAPLAMAAFDKMPRFHRKEFLQHIDDAKRPETRLRRINKMLVDLVD